MVSGSARVGDGRLSVLFVRKVVRRLNRVSWDAETVQEIRRQRTADDR
jgi:hypothetical protein